jgi:hypothetical protein
MEFRDIQDSLGTLHRLSAELEDQYIESEGEVTPEAEALEEEKEAVRHLLENDGIDALGRWLKLKEDEAKMWKAEKAAADRKIKSAENTIAFIKEKITEVMDATGMEKAKGTYYSFTKYESEKSTVNQEEIDRLYYAIAEAAVRAAGVPEWINLSLKATATVIKEIGATEFLDTTVTDTVRFTKPRGGKE